MSLLFTLFAKPCFYRQCETGSQQEQKDPMQPTDPHSLPGKTRQVQDLSKQKRLPTVTQRLWSGSTAAQPLANTCKFSWKQGTEHSYRMTQANFVKLCKSGLNTSFNWCNRTLRAEKHPLSRAPTETTQGRGDGSRK